jgi:hypothetical protein
MPGRSFPAFFIILNVFFRIYQKHVIKHGLLFASASKKLYLCGRYPEYNLFTLKKANAY